MRTTQDDREGCENETYDVLQRNGKRLHGRSNTREGETTAKGRRGRRMLTRRLKHINTLALVETSCHQPCFRPHHITILVVLPGEHPLRLDVEPLWFATWLQTSRRAPVRNILRPSPAPRWPNTRPHTLQNTRSASKARSPGVWERGDSRVVGLGGNVHGLYLPVLPSPTAAHAT